MTLELQDKGTAFYEKKAGLLGQNGFVLTYIMLEGTSHKMNINKLRNSGDVTDGPFHS